MTSSVLESVKRCEVRPGPFSDIVFTVSECLEISDGLAFSSKDEDEVTSDDFKKCFLDLSKHPKYQLQTCCKAKSCL